MAKHMADISIGQRMAEEVERVCSAKKIKLDLFASKNIRSDWRSGTCPGGLYLARLHYYGGDVLYVLTGHRRAVGS